MRTSLFGAVLALSIVGCALDDAPEHGPAKARTGAEFGPSLKLTEVGVIEVDKIYDSNAVYSYSIPVKNLDKLKGLSDETITPLVRVYPLAENKDEATKAEIPYVLPASEDKLKSLDFAATIVPNVPNISNEGEQVGGITVSIPWAQLEEGSAYRIILKEGNIGATSKIAEDATFDFMVSDIDFHALTPVFSDAHEGKLNFETVNALLSDDKVEDYAVELDLGVNTVFADLLPTDHSKWDRFAFDDYLTVKAVQTYKTGEGEMTKDLLVSIAPIDAQNPQKFAVSFDKNVLNQLHSTITFTLKAGVIGTRYELNENMEFKLVVSE